MYGLKNECARSAAQQLAGIMAGIINIDIAHDRYVKNRWNPQIPGESTVDSDAIRKARAVEKRERRAKKRGAL